MFFPHIPYSLFLFHRSHIFLKDSSSLMGMLLPPFSHTSNFFFIPFPFLLSCLEGVLPSFQGKPIYLDLKFHSLLFPPCTFSILGLEILLLLPSSYFLFTSKYVHVFSACKQNRTAIRDINSVLPYSLLSTLGMNPLAKHSVTIIFIHRPHTIINYFDNFVFQA